MKCEKLVLNEERNVTLTAYIQGVGGEWEPLKKRPAVLVLPGGGYSMCSDREADPVANAFLKEGYQAFILRYSVGDHRAWPNPLKDYEQAMELIRGRKDWFVDNDHVCVVGFSAGGHLAACAATVAKNRPNAALLGYAALTKEICDACQPGMPYPVEHVDENTPPCFLFATRNDYVVNIKNALAFENALADRGISFESHIYSHGPHGFTTAVPYEVYGNNISKRVKNWVTEGLSWLEEVWGEFTPRGFTQPVCDRIVNGDARDFLSADCTVGYLRSQENAAETVQPYLVMLDQFVQAKFGDKADSVAAAVVNDFHFSDALAALQLPEEKIREIDAALRTIKNEKR